MARCSSDDLRSLSKNSLLEAMLNRASHLSNVGKHLRQLKEEQMDLRSELAEINFLLAQSHTIQFPVADADTVEIVETACSEDKKKLT